MMNRVAHFSFRKVALLGLLVAGQALGDEGIDALVRDAGLNEGPVAARDLDGWRPVRKIVVRDIGGFPDALRAEYGDVEIVAVTSAAEAVAAASGADAIIGYCSEDIAAAADRAHWIQIFSAGAERCLGVDAVAGGDILLTNMQKMSSPVIGEHAVAMLLSLARGIVPYAKQMPDGNWDPNLARGDRMVVLAGKTVLVVGLGGIGTAVAKRAHALQMTVIATRNSSRDGPDFVSYVGLSDELPALAGKADVIVNALPMTPATEDLFDAGLFAAMKPGTLFINVGRGGTVVTEDLVAALQDGRLAAAGLDVTDPEPLPPDHPLWQMDNVIITPHVSGSGGELERHGLLLMENVRRFIAGDALLNVVDPEKGY